MNSDLERQARALLDAALDATAPGGTDVDWLRRSALKAISNALRSGEEETWRPIESLPTDQRAILWTRVEDGDEEDEPTCIPGYVDQSGTWWMAFGIETLEEPAYWRPLPAPPSNSTREGE